MSIDKLSSSTLDFSSRVGMPKAFGAGCTRAQGRSHLLTKEGQNTQVQHHQRGEEGTEGAKGRQGKNSVNSG